MSSYEILTLFLPRPLGLREYFFAKSSLPPGVSVVAAGAVTVVAVVVSAADVTATAAADVMATAAAAVAAPVDPGC